MIDTNTGSATPVNLGSASPSRIAITPDGKTAYVTEESGKLLAIETATKQVAATIPIDPVPKDVAISPDGKTAYAINPSLGNIPARLWVINTATNQVATTIPLSSAGSSLSLSSIAISLDGRTAYVGSINPSNVSVVDIATKTATQTIPVTAGAVAIAINPDGKTAYVTNGLGTVSAIDTTNQVTTIPVGAESKGIAITPDGKTAYVANSGSGSVSVIDTAKNKVTTTIATSIGVEPTGIAITPDGKTAYVTNSGSGTVSAINTATNIASPTSIPVGPGPQGIAIAPDQPPAATFAVAAPRVRPGVPVSLDASASKDPDSPIASYAWSFGDGQSQTLGGTRTTHTFAKPGTYTISLKAADAEGCSTPDTFRFTGQTASCNGKASAQVAKTIAVAYPGVGVKCPKSAKRKGCAFKLQAIAKKPKTGKRPIFQSALAKAKAKAGRAAIVSLVPKPAFRSRLAQAKSILVKETLLAKGKRQTRYVKLRVVR